MCPRLIILIRSEAWIDITEKAIQEKKNKASEIAVLVDNQRGSKISFTLHQALYGDNMEMEFFWAEVIFSAHAVTLSWSLNLRAKNEAE